MTDKEIKAALDFQVGDIVQIAGGEYAGRAAVILGIGVYTTRRNEETLIYDLKLSDVQGVRLTARLLKFVRHGDI